jgi:hypothetical protein
MKCDRGKWQNLENYVIRRFVVAGSAMDAVGCIKNGGPGSSRLMLMFLVGSLSRP